MHIHYTIYIVVVYIVYTICICAYIKKFKNHFKIDIIWGWALFILNLLLQSCTMPDSVSGI